MTWWSPEGLHLNSGCTHQPAYRYEERTVTSCWRPGGAVVEIKLLLYWQRLFKGEIFGTTLTVSIRAFTRWKHSSGSYGGEHQFEKTDRLEKNRSWLFGLPLLPISLSSSLTALACKWLYTSHCSFSLLGPVVNPSQFRSFPRLLTLFLLRVH